MRTVQQVIIDTFVGQFADIVHIKVEFQLMTWLATVRFKDESGPRAFTGFVMKRGNIKFVNTIFLPDPKKTDVLVTLEDR